MTIEDKTRNEKIQNIINKEAAKIFTLSSRKIDKYEDLTGEEQTKFRKSFTKANRT